MSQLDTQERINTLASRERVLRRVLNVTAWQLTALWEHRKQLMKQIEELEAERLELEASLKGRHKVAPTERGRGRKKRSPADMIANLSAEDRTKLLAILQKMEGGEH